MALRLFRLMPLRAPLSFFSLTSPFSTNRRREVQEILFKNSKTGFENVHDALHLFDEMLQTRTLFSVINFTQLLVALVKMKQYSVAISMFRKMCALNISVNTYTISTIINCYCQLNLINYGFSMLGVMIKRGFTPNVVTYTVLIKGLDSPVEAGMLFKKLITLNEIEPDVVIYSTIISRLCRRRLVNHALDVFYDMRKDGVDGSVVTYNLLIQGLCEFSRWEEIEWLLREMDSKNISPDVYTSSILVNAYCREGRVEDAENVVRLMIERSEFPNVVTYNALMHGYCLRGEVDGAMAVVSMMKNMGIVPDIVTCGILLDGFCKEKGIDEAMSLFHAMESNGLIPNIYIYSILINGLCIDGQLNKAKNLFDNLSSIGLEADVKTYTMMIRGFCRKGLLDEANELLVQMEAKNCLPDDVTFNILIRGCIQNRKYNEACELKEKMCGPCGRGFSLDAYTTSMVLDVLNTEKDDPSALALRKKFFP
ncbi:hypothetical protein POM88_023851 [Heracleum sosnowskyi]|uniref:Pentatricopeptide repeat-containing protein n=1 Tax=Heracleum sosnowskyi TaxID=360622 RepID=A0AAD8MUT4_9APIA|nr:hypothetical protein POM88_023851 [Heracleum sosnowskyi]